MKQSKIFWLIIFLPFAIALALYTNDFNINTKEFLDLTLQLVWGIMVALGGGVVYLSKFNFSNNNTEHTWQKKIIKETQKICYPLLLQTLIFVFLSIIYTSKSYSTKAFGLENESYKNAAIFFDSVLMSLIITPAIFSIAVGMVCIYMAVHHEE